MNYFMKANDLYKSKDYINALSLYRKSAEERQFEAPSLYNSAVCYIKLKDYTSALPLIYKALAIKKESKYFFNLGYCYMMLNEPGKALIYFNTSWAMDNSDKECEKALTLICSKL